jgi:hypothetical protein
MQTNKEKQDKRKAEMQAAAERDGFATASAAITAWKNGKARLTKRAVDVWRAGGLKAKVTPPHATNANR